MRTYRGNENACDPWRPVICCLMLHVERQISFEIVVAGYLVDLRPIHSGARPKLSAGKSRSSDTASSKRTTPSPSRSAVRMFAVSVQEWATCVSEAWAAIFGLGYGQPKSGASRTTK